MSPDQVSAIMADFIEIELVKPDSFLIVKESLTRIGIPSTKDGKKSLTQTCHILQKRKRYFITHFLEMFLLDERGRQLDDEDILRRNTIAKLLEEWGLVKIMDRVKIDQLGYMDVSGVKILTFAEKSDWHLVSNYNVGANVHK